MLWAGEGPAPDLGGEPRDCPADLVGEVGVALDELRRLAGGQAQHVVEDEDLPVGARAGPNSDGRDAQSGYHSSAKVGRHALENEAERTRLLERPRVGEDPGRLALALALHLEAP